MQFKLIDAPTDTLTDAPTYVLTDTLTVAATDTPRDVRTDALIGPDRCQTDTQQIPEQRL